MIVPADIGAVHFLFGGAALLSLLAFSALILVPALSAFGRGWEKVTAAVLSLFVLVALLALGFGLGVVIVYYWSDISAWFG
jgi:hypothetical protein